MTAHADIEALLGAYALDAVEPAEATLVEAHLLSCPRCRAEVEAHREVASLLGHTGSDAPEGLWARIATELEADPPSMETGMRTALAQLRPAQRATPRRRTVALVVGLALGAAAAVVIIVLLAVQVANLDGRVGKIQAQAHKNTIAAVVAAALAGPHHDVTLVSSDRRTTATLAVAGDGEAYWLGSNLRSLPADRTYQLWGLSKGRAVSLGLLGPSARGYAIVGRVRGITRIMLTAEPQGGTPAPTTAVLVQGDVPPIT